VLGAPVQALNIVASSSTPAFNWATSTNQKTVMTSGISPTFSNPAHVPMTLILTQDGTGGHPVTWPAGVSSQTPQPSLGANTSTVYEFIYDTATSKYLVSGTPVGGQ